MERKVDLVMTAYNSAGFIERALDSVLRQTVRPHVIIVDDASTDGTAERVESYAERTDWMWNCCVCLRTSVRELQKG